MGTPPCHRIVLVHASSSNISINNLTSSSSPLCIGPANSNIKLKVFKDPWMGIVCYKDEKGERNCEGYDEGPHFCSNSLFSLIVGD
ncbi:hypothetical protein HAX54_018814 [Datura stramonium]|uniref:Uncharacterized protein n=1 Tax=Datura stramonium TaxID=4076 RepID=A0ABS8UQB3_DATST|nr:hypothetical protein [Datura stramonium]